MYPDLYPDLQYGIVTRDYPTVWIILCQMWSIPRVNWLVELSVDHIVFSRIVWVEGYKNAKAVSPTVAKTNRGPCRDPGLATAGNNQGPWSVLRRLQGAQSGCGVAARSIHTRSIPDPYIPPNDVCGPRPRRSSSLDSSDSACCRKTVQRVQ